MPYVQRDAAGRIQALLRHPADGADFVDAEDAELRAFLGEAEQAATPVPRTAPSERAAALHLLPAAANDEPDVIVPLPPAAAPQAFDDLDRDFVRVLEDVVDALISRGVIAITDLPPEARDKLMSRKSYRERVIGTGLVMDGADMDEAIGRAGFGV